MAKVGSDLYVKSLKDRIEAEDKIIEQLFWWLSAQEDYQITTPEGADEVRDDLSSHRSIRAKYVGYLKAVESSGL